MILGSLRGTLIDRSTGGEVLIDVGGIGYRVRVAPAASVAMGDIGDEVFVHVHHHIRDDAQMLFGFARREERACFEVLIGAHGVGPALALAILSVHEPVALQRVVIDEDVDALCLVPGVGKKTAQRLLMELKNALDLPDLDLRPPTTTGAGHRSSTRADLREALSGLGYGTEEIRQVLLEIPDEGDPADLLRQALQQLAVSR